MRALLAGVAASLLMAGCATTWHPRSASRTIDCISPAECDALWSRLQVNLTQWSRFRIRIASDSVIETYGPQQYVNYPAYQFVRQRNADGSGKVVINAFCAATLYGCVYSPANQLDVIYFSSRP